MTANATQLRFDLSVLLTLLTSLVTATYFVGWNYGRAYWRRLDASWVMDTYPAAFSLVDSAAVTLPIVSTLAFTMLWFGPKAVNSKTNSLAQASVYIVNAAAAALGLIAFRFADWFANQDWNWAKYLYIGNVLLCVVFGWAVACIALRLLRESSWHNDGTAGLLMIVTVLPLFTLPTQAGEFRAISDSSRLVSELYLIDWPEQPRGDWRLVRVTDSGFVVIRLTTDAAVNETRLLPLSADTTIRKIGHALIEAQP